MKTRIILLKCGIIFAGLTTLAAADTSRVEGGCGWCEVVGLLQRTKKILPLPVYAFTVMPNHFHLLVAS